MANTNNVSWGKPKIGGAINVAPIGTALPDNAKDDIEGAFKNLGYISDDGLSNTNSPESEKIKAWGGDTVLVVSTEKPDTFKFKLIEALNIDVLKTIYGSSNVSGTLETGLKLKANAKPSESMSFVIDMILAGGVLKRIVIPNGVVSAVDTIDYKDEDTVGYGVTLEALPDREGNNHYEYILKEEE